MSDAYDWAQPTGGQAAPAPVGWPAGNYEGTLLSAEMQSSSAKGTPGFKLWFDVKGRTIGVDVWLTDASARMSTQALTACGWNFEYGEACAFAAIGSKEKIKLWLKYEHHDGRQKERWNVSTFRAPPPATDPGLAAFAARARAIAAESGIVPQAAAPSPAAARTPPTAPAPAATPPTAQTAPDQSWGEIGGAPAADDIPW